MKRTVFNFYIKPECTTVFKTALLEDKKGTEQETGNLEMKIFVNNNNPNIFFAYERFNDQISIDHHMQQPYTQKLFELFDTALQTPAEVFKLGETQPAPLYDSNPNKPKSEDDLFIIFFIFKNKDGYREKVLKQFETHIASTRREEVGNILFDLYTIDTRFLERWVWRCHEGRYSKSFWQSN